MTDLARNLEIIRQRQAGVPPLKIAKALKLSPNAVAGVIRRAGLCTEKRGRGHGLPSSTVEAMRQQRRQGVTARAIARRFDVHEQTAIKYTKDA